MKTLCNSGALTLCPLLLVVFLSSEIPLAGVVRRAASRPISIIRSTSVPGQLQDRSQPPAAPGAGGSSGGNTTTSSKRALHVRDRSLQHDFKSNAAGGFGGIVQSLPIPQAPLLAGSLPPSRFLDDLPPLSLGPQVRRVGRTVCDQGCVIFFCCRCLQGRQFLFTCWVHRNVEPFFFCFSQTLLVLVFGFTRFLVNCPCTLMKKIR